MENIALAPIDFVVMGIYLMGLILMGLYYRKFAGQGLENYFLGGRTLPGWLNGVSYAATCMNADVAPAYCGMTVISGLFVYWWYISRFSLALMIGGILFAVYWRKLKIFTSPEFYEMRFAGNCALTMRSWVALRSAFIAVVAWSGAGLLGLFKVSNSLFGWDKWEIFAILIPVILIYVLLSGFMGVVVSDLIQTLVIVLASIILMILVLVDFHGPANLCNQLVSHFGEQVVQWHPPKSHELLGIVGIICWTIGTAIGYGGDVAPMGGAMEGQRILSCKNSKEASKMYIWTQVVLFFLLAILTLPALGAMVKWPGLYDGSINKELAYGMLLKEYLPPGILGLAVIALLASIMSTIDSNMNFGSQVFINDIYRRLIKREAPVSHYMNVGKIVMFVILGLAVVVAVYAQDVIDISVFMLGLASTELTANWAQWWWWRFNGKARLAASFGGPLIFILNKIVVFKYLIVLEDPTYVVILTSIGLTCLLWIVVALCTKPEPDEVLIKFYRSARPMGWWGPIARKANIKPTEINILWRGFIIAILGSVMISSGVIVLANLYLAKYMVASIATVTCVFALLIFRKTYHPYIKKLINEEELVMDDSKNILEQ